MHKYTVGITRPCILCVLGRRCWSSYMNTSQVGVTAPSQLSPSFLSPILWWASGRHPSSLKNLHTCINLNNKELKQERSPRWWHCHSLICCSCKDGSNDLSFFFISIKLPWAAFPDYVNRRPSCVDGSNFTEAVFMPFSNIHYDLHSENYP